MLYIMDYILGIITGASLMVTLLTHSDPDVVMNLLF